MIQPIFIDETPLDLVKLCSCFQPCDDFPRCLGWLDEEVEDNREEEPEEYDATIAMDVPGVGKIIVRPMSTKEMESIRGNKDR